MTTRMRHRSKWTRMTIEANESERARKDKKQETRMNNDDVIERTK